MGNMFSSDSRQANLHKHPQYNEWRKFFHNLAIYEKDLRRFWKIYCGIDKDGDGELSLNELLDHLNLERTVFNKRVFSIFDEDNSGEISFKEFILSMWNYCTLTRESLLIFAFDLYDTDSSGAIDLPEMKQMLREAYGNRFEKSPYAAKILKQINRMIAAEHGSVCVDTFCEFSRTHQGLLYPAFALQTSLRKKIVNTDYWDKMARRRLDLGNGTVLTIKQILESHVNQNAFNAIAKKSSDSDGDSHFGDVFNSTGTKNQRRDSQASAEKKLSNAALKLKAAGGFSIRDIKKESADRRREIKKVTANLFIDDVDNEATVITHTQTVSKKAGKQPESEPVPETRATNPNGRRQSRAKARREQKQEHRRRSSSLPTSKIAMVAATTAIDSRHKQQKRRASLPHHSRHHAVYAASQS